MRKKHTPIFVGVLVSGSGTTFDFLQQAMAQGTLCTERCSVEISTVIADRPCLAIERAASAGIPTQLLSRKILGRKALDQNLAALLQASACDVVLLAGYLSIIGPQVLASVQAQTGRIWNMHPSLLPQYGGMGMYGMNVHRAVFAAGEAFSGCTLHQVSEGVDKGAILRQRSVAIGDCQTAEEIAERIQALEKEVLLEYLQEFLQNYGKL